jgi:chromosome partitioning protein
MRGRRRGRNRPPLAGDSTSGFAETASSKAGATVTVLDVSDADDGPSEDTAATEATDSGMEVQAIVRPTEVSGDSLGRNSTEPPPVDSGVSTVDKSMPVVGTAEVAPDSGPSLLQEPAVEVATGETQVTAPTVESPGMGEVPSVEPAASSTPALAGKNASTALAAGRQPQAASGNPLPRILAVANQKGGVGKTTTSVNLGAALAELGFRVLVIDLDPQGNATTGLGIDARNFELSMYDVLMRDSSLEDCVEPTSMKNLFVAPATIALAGAEIELVPAFSRELKLKRAIESIIDDFDYVLIDCPPSLGLITVNALAAADEVLVPIQCEYYALEGLSQLMRNVHLVASNLNPRLDISTIVLTMYDARTKLSDQVATEVREHFGNKVCRIVIPRTVRLSEAFDPASRGAIAYRELAKEVSGGTS